MEQRTGFKLGKEYIKAIFCHLTYLTYLQSTSSEMLGWMNSKLESRLLGEISITQICRLYYPNGRKQRGAKEPLDEGEKRRVKKLAQNSTFQNTKTMVFGPITPWQTDGETMETVTDFIFLGSKITVDGDCSHESKRCLLLGRKAMINPGSILKSKRHHFADKGPYSQSYGLFISHVRM